MNNSIYSKPSSVVLQTDKRREYIFIRALLIMKLTLFLTLLLSLQVQASALAQRISLSFTNAPLQEVLDDVSSQSDYNFLLDTKLLGSTSNVTIKLSQRTLSETLDILFKDQPLAYQIKGKNILVFARFVPPAPSTEVVSAQAEVRGRVVDSLGNALPGASVRVINAQGQRTTLQTVTDRAGEFILRNVPEDATLQISYVGYLPKEIKVRAEVGTVTLQVDASEIDAVEVVVNTGYQSIPKERATGSFEFVDNKLFNRKISTDFASRLEDIVPSINSFKNFGENKGRLLNINIRGRSTMGANAWPLVVVDGVPYENIFFDDFDQGYFMNINPNDIENVTVLKDAAAASIWGSQSANGVLVITTKKGKYGQPLKASISSNLSIAEKPDLFYEWQMNSSDYIDLERDLFDRGYWNSRIYRYTPNLTPVIQLLKKQKEGSITMDELNAGLDELRGIDVRNDFLKYIYRPAVNQQHNVQLSGGSDKVATFISAGFDKNLNSVVTSSYERFTIKNNTQLRPVKKLTINFGIGYTENKHADSRESFEYNKMRGRFPYMKLADEQGNPLPVDAGPYNPIFRDTLAGGRLLNWDFIPLAELNESPEIRSRKEVMLTLSADYQVLPWLKITALYGKQGAQSLVESRYGLGSIEMRNTINYNATWTADQVTFNIPVGDRLYRINRRNLSQQGRFQMDFNQNWSNLHQLDAVAGTEIRQVTTDMESADYWGYNHENLSFVPLQVGLSIRPLGGTGGTTMLRDRNQMSNLINRYTAFFGNASYTYNKRYILSVSARRDASNLFGVKANFKGQPFWSIGGAWMISSEPFVNAGWLPYLKIRATYGYNGNVNNNFSAYPIIDIQSQPHWVTGQPYATMRTPPNPGLRWERVGTFNIGVDFSLKNNRLAGSIEYYIKNSKDLITGAPVDATTGFSELAVNSGNLKGKGIDLQLNSINIDHGDFTWRSNLIFAYNRVMVSKSYLSYPVGNHYVVGPNGQTNTPIVDRDLQSILTFPWAGLDPETGEALGYVNGEISKDYSAIWSGTHVNDLDYHGSSVPLYFGSFRNSLQYGSLEFSFNIAFKLGHKFLRKTFVNTRFISNGSGHSDYINRWQKPGDEKWTDIPAWRYPANLYADYFFEGSSALVESASIIKLRDLQLSYTLPKTDRIPFKNVQISAYLLNVATLWRANKHGIDTESGYLSFTRPEPLQLSLGLKFDL